MNWEQMCAELARLARNGEARVFRRRSWHPLTIVGKKNGQHDPDTSLIMVSYGGSRFTDWVPHSIDLRAKDWEIVPLPTWVRMA